MSEETEFRKAGIVGQSLQLLSGAESYSIRCDSCSLELEFDSSVTAAKEAWIHSGECESPVHVIPKRKG